MSGRTDQMVAWPADHPGRRLMLRRGAVEDHRHGEFPGRARIDQALVFLDENGAPRAYLCGAVTSLDVGGEAVTLEGGLPMVWEYRFVRSQLVELAGRGLLEGPLGGCFVFDGLVGREFDVPARVRLSMLELDPDGAGEPVLFVERWAAMGPALVTVGNSDVDLVEFFQPSPETDPLEAGRAEAADMDAGLEGVDLFDDEPDAPQKTISPSAGAAPVADLLAGFGFPAPDRPAATDGGLDSEDLWDETVESANLLNELADIGLSEGFDQEAPTVAPNQVHDRGPRPGGGQPPLVKTLGSDLGAVGDADRAARERDDKRQKYDETVMEARLSAHNSQKAQALDVVPVPTAYRHHPGKSKTKNTEPVFDDFNELDLG